MKDFLTMSEISKLEKVSKQAVWYWVRRGLFPNARKVGNQIRIPIRDYHRWRESTKIINSKYEN
jgi:predicted DNA-binding transcriptional regulator AlpA